MAGSGTNALGWHARCWNIPFVNNSMLCIPTFSLDPWINFLHMGKYYSVMMVLSCNAEYYQLYRNGRELSLFNCRMIKCLYITCTCILINSFLWISILPCSHLRLSVCNVKYVREEYNLSLSNINNWYIIYYNSVLWQLTSRKSQFHSTFIKFQNSLSWNWRHAVLYVLNIWSYHILESYCWNTLLVS